MKSTRPDRDLRSLKALITFLKENGITHYKDGEFELNLGSVSQPAETIRQTQEIENKDSSKSMFLPEELSPEDLLFWSSNADVAPEPKNNTQE